MLSSARQGEAVRRPADRATRDSEGPASSGEPDKHRGRRHRLPALVLASWAAAMVAKVPCNLTPRHPPSQVLDNLPRYGC